MAGRYATRQTQLYCLWQRVVDTVAHKSMMWEWGLREHTLSGILSLPFRAASDLKGKGRERRTQRLVSYESDLLCGVVSNCAHILSTYGVCAELNNSPRRRAAHVLDTDEAGARIYYPALTKL